MIYNNKGGRDAALLKRFKEPSWNNPVFRFLNHKSEDITPRKANIWTTPGVTTRMVQALKAADREVPLYLKGLHKELTANTKTITFAMHCYWDGEAKLGSIDGVLKTRAGWHDRREVVELQYDPTVASLKSLIQEAKKFDCASKVYVQDNAALTIAKAEVGTLAELRKGPVRDAKASDQKFALGRSPHQYLPLTPWQATKVNAALRLGQNTDKWLSPEQIKRLTQIKLSLKADPRSLSGLKRPKDLSQLADYQAKLLLKLNKTKK